MRQPMLLKENGPAAPEGAYAAAGRLLFIADASFIAVKLIAENTASGLNKKSFKTIKRKGNRSIYTI